ncbi:MAG TPA: pseudouridine synthase [Candidatus Angelobacter sp.]|nr:pseudouridine synthase [Candidatus Angelobacter sp.]
MSRPPRKGDHRPRLKGPRQARFPRAVAVLYEDDSVIAIDKPAGLLAVPIKGSDAPSALTVVAAELKRKRQRAFIVHRIDRFASGILLFAKTPADRESLVRQFLRHTPVREYLAVVRGHLTAKAGTLVHYFRRQGMFQKQSVAGDPRAARAELKYSVAELLRGASLLRVTLGTGLQNQIRVQFAAMGHPIIGDRKYFKEEAAENRIDRVALHAARLQFIHPRSGEIINIECEEPADFRSLVSGLRQRGRQKSE